MAMTRRGRLLAVSGVVSVCLCSAIVSAAAQSPESEVPSPVITDMPSPAFPNPTGPEAERDETIYGYNTSRLPKGPNGGVTFVCDGIGPEAGKATRAPCRPLTVAEVKQFEAGERRPEKLYPAPPR